MVAAHAPNVVGHSLLIEKRDEGRNAGYVRLLRPGASLNGLEKAQKARELRRYAIRNAV
jgi:hypothetical protein